MLKEHIDFAKDLHNWFAQDLLIKESLDTTPLEDAILFELTYQHSPRKIYTVWIIIDYDTLYDIKPGQRYCILGFMSILLYDIRKNKEPGRYRVTLELV